MADQGTRAGGRSRIRIGRAVGTAIVISIVLGVVLHFTVGGNLNKGRKAIEAAAGATRIRVALRVYAAGNQKQYPALASVNGEALAPIGITPEDLNGKYLKACDYVVTSAPTTFSIRATLPGGGPGDFYEINQDGAENPAGYRIAN